MNYIEAFQAMEDGKTVIAVDDNSEEIKFRIHNKRLEICSDTEWLVSLISIDNLMLYKFKLADTTKLFIDTKVMSSEQVVDVLFEGYMIYDIEEKVIYKLNDYHLYGIQFNVYNTGSWYPSYLSFNNLMQGKYVLVWEE